MARRVTSLFGRNTKLMILLFVAVIFFNQYYAYASSSLALREGMDDGASKGKSVGDAKIIYFSMEGCGHCKKFNQVWDDFTKETKSKGSKCPIKTEEIKSDNTSEINKYKVSAYPTVMLVKDGQQIVFKGERTVDALKAFCHEHASRGSLD